MSFADRPRRDQARGSACRSESVERTRVEPVQPGVPSGARRPGILCLAPARSLLLGGVAAAFLAVLVRWGGLALPDDTVFWAIVLSAFALLVAGEFRAREADHARLCDRVGAVHVAWLGLERASGLSWAVEQNLMDADDRYRLLLSPEQKESLHRIYVSLRDLALPGRPVTGEELRRQRHDRDRTLRRLNRDIIGIFGSRALAGGREPFEVCRVDREGLARLDAAMTQWDEAVAAAVAAVVRWPVLSRALERCDLLVKESWLYVLNDPCYRDGDEEKERRRALAHRQAEDAVNALRDGVGSRSIGHPTWRALLLRGSVGRRQLETTDRAKDLIRD